MSTKLEGIPDDVVAYLCRHGRMALGDVVKLTGLEASNLADAVSRLVAKENGDKRITGAPSAVALETIRKAMIASHDPNVSVFDVLGALRTAVGDALDTVGFGDGVP